MYVVKVGEYYVRSIDDFLNNITLSKEIMRSFTKTMADIIARKIKGEVVEIKEVQNGK